MKIVSHLLINIYLLQSVWPWYVVKEQKLQRNGRRKKLVLCISPHKCLLSIQILPIEGVKYRPAKKRIWYPQFSELFSNRNQTNAIYIWWTVPLWPSSITHYFIKSFIGKIHMVIISKINEQLSVFVYAFLSTLSLPRLIVLLILWISR